METLERGNLFLVPLDNERRWYRYHHLFADALRARLLAEHPDDVLSRYRRASDWYDSQGQAPAAVRYALDAKDFDRAAYLMQVALPQVRRMRQDGVLPGRASALPESVIRRSPVLCVLSGWSMMMTGDSRQNGPKPTNCAQCQRRSRCTGRRWRRRAASRRQL